MFRAFLHYTGEELDNMGIDEYLKCNVALIEALKILHAPYMNHE